MEQDRQSRSTAPLRRVGRASFRLAVLAVATLSLLPLADWIPGEPGTDIPPPLWPLYALWALGLAVLGAIAWGVAWLWGRWSRRARASRRSDAEPAAESGSGRGSRRILVGLLLVAVATLLYARVATGVFDRLPLHVDALTQALQAHVFADGRLSVPAPQPSRFFSSSLVIEHEGRAFSQFPPGWSALLALGFLAGLPWLVAPLLGAAAVGALHYALREGGEDGRTALLAAVLFGLSPWFVVNAASWMSHVPSLAFILLGTAALVRSARDPGAALHGALAGAALGIATWVRPLEGVAFGLPATVWVLGRWWGARAATRPGHGAPHPGRDGGAESEDPRPHAALRSLVGFAVGGGVTIGLLLLYNAVQHGSPALFGFELQWGPEHGLGFHEAPWGPPHTLVRGIELMNGYLLSLQLLFFDAPAPSLVLALIALMLAHRLDALDRHLLAGCALVMLGYVAFWGEGHDLGPRYLIPLAPVVAIWTARFGSVLAERGDRPDLKRFASVLVVLLLVSGWVFGTPTRWFVYSRVDPLRRVDAGVLGLPRAERALVFVPTPWSIQVQARLRATGMSRQQAEWFYRRVGLCKLDVALSDVEARGLTEPDAIVATLMPLAADSVHMVPDRTAGTPGHPYAGITRADGPAVTLCRAREEAVEARGGYLLLPFAAQVGPTWLEDGPIVAHDLHEENRRLLAAHPGRDAYWLRTLRVRADGVREFALEPLDADSVAADWTRLERLQREATVF